ncbi:MAG: IPT/TIG domain-containing protein, partial [Cytophagales bacterium]|nr:IPT/TIG domain-containing protein [Cytophagales bacterium]
AYRVVVADTLSGQLDLSTLRVVGASHPYRFAVSGKGRPVLTFTFEDINLPDSTRDQAGSNGFIQFSIKPLADLPARTRVENFADIFFDYNPPIRTNTLFNRIYDVPPVVAAADRLEVGAVVATPVITGFTPTSGAAGTVVALTGMHFDPVPARNRVTFNGIAATVTAATATTLVVTVPPGEVAGRIRVTTDDGATLSATDFSLAVPPPTAVTPGLLAGAVRIYPNPAPGRFVVEFAQPVRGVTEIVTLNARGQRVHTLSLAGKPASRAEIDLAGHPAGMYLVLIWTERGITTRKVTLRP